MLGILILALQAPESGSEATTSTPEIEVFFSTISLPPLAPPFDELVVREIIAEELIKAINNAKSRIFIAIYSITHMDISSAIADISKRVEVKIVVDSKELMRNSFSRSIICQLVNKGVLVRVFNLWQKGLMHNKYAIIDDDFWTGSFNFTNGAQEVNQENAVIIKGSKKVIKKAEENFYFLWEHSSPLAPTTSLFRYRTEATSAQPPAKRCRHK